MRKFWRNKCETKEGDDDDISSWKVWTINGQIFWLKNYANKTGDEKRQQKINCV